LGAIEENNMRFMAELMFCNPDDADDAITALAAVGVKFEIDLANPEEVNGSLVAFGMASGTTTLAEDDIGDWLSDIIEPHHGSVVQWRYDPLWVVK
jgi:hypothetical protein